MSVQSTPEFGIRLRAHLAGRRRGFTAIEMVAVATIMVILSLILVINVRKRVDESKIAAAKEEINQLGNIESLVYGETGHYVPLQDLDNTNNYPAFSGTDLPMAYYPVTAKAGLTTITQYAIPPLVDQQRFGLQKTWMGPYTQFKKYTTLGFIGPLRPEFFLENGGFIAAAENPWLSGNLIDPGDRYPIDPWGNPYIFEVLPNNQGCRIYSLGPDGLPGISSPPVLPAVIPGLAYHTFDAVNNTQGKLSNPVPTGSDDIVQDF